MVTAPTAGTQRQRRAPGGIARLMVPLMLVLFISNLDGTVVSTAVAAIGRSLHDAAGRPGSPIPNGFVFTRPAPHPSPGARPAGRRGAQRAAMPA